MEPFSVAYSASVAADGIDASDEVAVIGGGSDRSPLRDDRGDNGVAR